MKAMPHPLRPRSAKASVRPAPPQRPACSDAKARPVFQPAAPSLRKGSPMTLQEISMNENRPAVGRILCRERRRRQPPEVSGPLAVHNRTAIFAEAARRAAAKRFKHDRPHPSKPPHRARSARPRRRPPQGASPRARARAASHRVDNSMLRSRVAMLGVLCRERRLREPPEVSGPFAVHNRTAMLGGAAAQAARSGLFPA